jgi:hypothetical protein
VCVCVCVCEKVNALACVYVSRAVRRAGVKYRT